MCTSLKVFLCMALPWQSGSEDPVPPMQRGWVLSLVQGLRYCMPRRQTKYIQQNTYTQTKIKMRKSSSLHLEGVQRENREREIKDLNFLKPMSCKT